ncbi:MAG: hypothetical protein R2932_09170 [Caldilineaceae bacterium]
MDLSRLSTCTFPLKDRPLDQALPIIAAAGYKRIDLLGRMPHFSLDVAECDPTAVLALTKEHGLEIANWAPTSVSAWQALTKLNKPLRSQK